MDASDPRIVYLPTLEDGNWGISLFNDTDTEIRAYDDNFTVTFQYTGEYVTHFKCFAQMLMVRPVYIGSSVSLLADPKNFYLEQYNIIFDNNNISFSLDDLNITENSDGLFEFFSMNTTGSDLHTVMVWESFLTKKGGWNLVAVMYAMFSFILVSL